MQIKVLVLNLGINLYEIGFLGINGIIGNLEELRRNLGVFWNFLGFFAALRAAPYMPLKTLSQINQISHFMKLGNIIQKYKQFQPIYTNIYICLFNLRHFSILLRVFTWIIRLIYGFLGILGNLGIFKEIWEIQMIFIDFLVIFINLGNN